MNLPLHLAVTDSDDSNFEDIKTLIQSCPTRLLHKNADGKNPMELAEDSSKSNVIKALVRECTGLLERGELELIKKLCRQYLLPVFCDFFNKDWDMALKYLSTITDEEAYDEITFVLR
jgi:hypothetical protein